MHFEVNYIGWPGVECRRAPRNATRWGLLSVDPSHPAGLCTNCPHSRQPQFIPEMAATCYISGL